MFRVILCVSLIAVGCGEDKSGIPQPDPIPNLMRIRSMGASENERGPVDMIGLDEATAGSGEVTVKSPSETKTVQATEAGSFFVSVQAKKGEVLEITYKKSDAVALTVSTLNEVIATEPILMLDPPPITIPVNGKTTISGIGDAGLAVTGINVANGAIALSKADESSRFSFLLEASSGDEVRVYLDEDPIGLPWVQTVP